MLGLALYLVLSPIAPRRKREAAPWAGLGWAGLAEGGPASGVCAPLHAVVSLHARPRPSLNYFLSHGEKGIPFLLPFQPFRLHQRASPSLAPACL